MSERRTALITGASAGIGKAFAEQLAKDGWNLVLTARRKDRLEEIAREISTDRGVRVDVVVADLIDPLAPQQLFDELQQRRLQIDMLVNNAGWGIADRFVEVPWQKHAEFIQVLVTAVAHLTRLFLPGMIERRYGRIVNVASLAGLLPGAPTSTLYAAAKSFLVKFSESLAAEVEGSGVHVSALCPGFTYSEFHDVMGTRGVVGKLPGAMWQNADSVAREGIDAVMRNQVVRVTGPVNRALAVVMQHLPTASARSIMRARAKNFRNVGTH
ncbi:MAG TPA: SDR family oxidoreductase [Polyangiales bacterium]|jgi:hypothetical protein|nr:SDR family oxidoreductase [Polyangiales bacterium]